MSRGGFDVVIGNPPYIARKTVLKSYTTKGFRTEGCPDIYAMVVERSVSVAAHRVGRIGMIVPLSLAFSRGFTSLRALLYERCGPNWFSSFGRIPAALFSFDTRVRNTIYLGQKAPGAPASCFTSRLHRWFEEQRTQLFDCLSYAPCSPEHFDGDVPKIGSAQLLEAFQSLVGDKPARFEAALSTSPDGHELHYKTTAYNWLTFCVEKPPVFGPNGEAVLQTKYGTVRFRDQTSRDLVMLLACGKLMFLWWCALGDDFDLTKSTFVSAPCGGGKLPEATKRSLLAMVPSLQAAMAENVVFKKNAGKNIGNYNLARCRDITDRADKLWLEALGLGNLWEEIEMEHDLVVRTSFEDEEE